MENIYCENKTSKKGKVVQLRRKRPVRMMPSTVAKLCNLLDEDFKYIESWYRTSHVDKRFDGRSMYQLNTDEFSELWLADVSSQFFGDSCITPEKQSFVVRYCAFFMEGFIKRRSDMMGRLRQHWERAPEGEKQTLLRTAAWHSINTTNPSGQSQYRLQIGLRTTGCQYRSKDIMQRGCFNCGFFATTAVGVDLTKQDILSQYDTTLESVGSQIQKRIVPSFGVIEFPSDGSFLNTHEVPAEVVKEICCRIAKLPTINRIMFESRPEHITGERIKEILQLVRDDQLVEIGIGLETTDTFIHKFSIHKGYGQDDYEKVAKLLSKYDRCSLFAYAILKPAYVRDEEAIEDAIKTCRYVNKIGEKYKIQSMVKYEPAVVSEGTLLDVLYDHFNEDERFYQPPSYWTVAEVLARLHRESLEHLARIGAREDMDLFKAIPALYHSNGMLSRFDFILYDAIQQFNIHHNINLLLVDIQKVFYDNSYISWKRDLGLTKPEIEVLLQERAEVCNKIRETPACQKKQTFFDQLFQVLDTIEYGEESQRIARNAADLMKPEEMSLKITEWTYNFLISKFKNVGVAITNVQKLDDQLGLIRMEVDIYHHQLHSYHNLWINIPSKRRVPLEEVENGYLG